QNSFATRVISAESKDPEGASFAMPASGSSYENVLPAHYGLEDSLGQPTVEPLPPGRFFIRRHRQHSAPTVRRTRHGKNSLCQHDQGRILGVLRLRAHHFRKAPTRSGASLRMTGEGLMTEGGVMEEPHTSKRSMLTRTGWNSIS